MAKIHPLTDVACPICWKELPPIPLVARLSYPSDSTFGVAVYVDTDITDQWRKQVSETHPTCVDWG